MTILSERQRVGQQEGSSCVNSGKEVQKQKESPLPLLAAPVGANLMATLRVLGEIKSKSTCPREGRAQTCSKESVLVPGFVQP